jgi:hypothetical protein
MQTILSTSFHQLITSHSTPALNSLTSIRIKQACPIIALKIKKKIKKHEVNPDVLFATTCTCILYYVM